MVEGSIKWIRGSRYQDIGACVEEEFLRTPILCQIGPAAALQYYFRVIFIRVRPCGSIGLSFDKGPGDLLVLVDDLDEIHAWFQVPDIDHLEP